MGDLFMDVVRDDATGLCYPTIMVRIATIEEPIALTTLLEKLGINMAGILTEPAMING
jgi:hypothetical protein